jgi:hypothetical protein
MHLKVVPSRRVSVKAACDVFVLSLIVDLTFVAFSMRVFVVKDVAVQLRIHEGYGAGGFLTMFPKLVHTKWIVSLTL